MGGPTVAGFEGSFVLQLIHACPCNFCAKMVQKHLEEIHGIGSISTDAAEGKITISGSMVDPYTVIAELEKLMKKATLFSEENPIEKQIVLHKSEVLEGLSEVEPDKPAENNQVVDKFASSSSPDIQSKHEHELELINFHEKVTISALYLVLVFVMAGFGGQFLIRNLVDFLRRASIILFFLSGFIFASALIMGSMVALYTVITELEKLKKKVTLLGGEIPIKNTIEEKQIVLRKSEVLEGQVGLCKPADNNQVVGEFALSLSPDIQSKHEHMLELQNFDKRFTCSGCKEEGFRKRYRCKHCDYELHEECRHPKPTISHELFEGLDFKFCHEKPTCGILCRDHTKSCEACGNGIHGYSYHCEAKDLFLHPMCVNLLGKICILGKTFALKKKGTIKCSWCNSTKKTKSGWSYVSKSTKWQLHVNCVTEIAHQAWKEQDVGGGNDPYIMIEKRLNSGLVENKKRSKWFKVGGKSVKMILVFARTIIGILLGDPTVILASTFVEIFKKS